MRGVKSVALYLMSWAAASSASGTMLDEAEIETAARTFLRQGVGAAVLKGRSLESVSVRGNLRVAHYAPSGYAVFSGSDRCAPVVGFSENDFVEPGEDDAFYALLAGADDACAAVEAAVQGTRDVRWAKLIPPNGLAPKAGGVSDYGTVIVPPFLTTHWNQNQPYNDFCPIVTPNGTIGRTQGRSPCGCVATAAAQVLAYWKWPARTDSSSVVTHQFFRTSSSTAWESYAIRFDGHVPFDWASLQDTYYLDKDRNDVRGVIAESVRYPMARLMLFCDSLANMMFEYSKSESNLGTVVGKLRNGKWFTGGTSYSLTENHDLAISTAKANLRDGVPVLVSMKNPNHALVAHGWAEDGLNSYIYLNYGNYTTYGNSDGYYSLSTSIASNVITELFVNLKPNPRVQFDPIPAVVGTSATVGWQFPDCYANSVAGFTLYADRVNASGVPYGDYVSASVSGASRSATLNGLRAGERYALSIQPTMTGSIIGSLSDSVYVSVAAAGTPVYGLPEITSVASQTGSPTVQEGFYRECAIGTNVFLVACSDKVVSLEAIPSHLALVDDSKVNVKSLGGGDFVVVVDGTGVTSASDRTRMILTLRATDENGTSAYKDLSLRFSTKTAGESYVEAAAVTVTDETLTVEIPRAWFDEKGLVAPGASVAECEAAASFDTDGDGVENWKEYVCGTDPCDGSDYLEATISIEGGEPVVGHNLDESELASRGFTATIQGKALLSDEWGAKSGNSRFFRVVVTQDE